MFSFFFKFPSFASYIYKILFKKVSFILSFDGIIQISVILIEIILRSKMIARHDGPNLKCP
jgi:hypothetical protein